MKIRFFTCLLALAAIVTSARAQVTINTSKFPDANFRSFVSTNYDTDKNGTLSKKELEAVTDMPLTNKNISSLRGVEHFTKLKKLYCGANKLTVLDVSSNTELVYLSCYDNQLTSLDLSKNTKLIELSCYTNQLTSLYIGSNSNLTRIDCANNQLTSINVSKLTKLQRLTCYFNNISGAGMKTIVDGLRTYNGGELRVISPSDTREKNFITTTQVTTLKSKGWKVQQRSGTDWVDYAGGDPGHSIVSRKFPDANFRAFLLDKIDGDKDGYLNKGELAATTTMNVASKNIVYLDGIEYFTELEELTCSKNKIAKLDVSKLTKLKNLGCNENQLTTLDVSKNTALKNLTCWGNKINGSGMQALVNSLPKVSSGDFYVYFNWTLEENVITKPQVAAAKAKGWTVRVAQGSIYDGVDPGIEINATNFPDANFRSFVAGTTIDKDKDGYLSTSEIAAVTEINVNRKSISNLKGIEHFTALTRLICFANYLTTLDISKLTKLTSLDCSYNNLTSLTVSSSNTALRLVECYGNRINGTAMQTLVNSLPRASSGEFYAIDTTHSGEQNVITKTQVNTVKGKGWKVYDYQGDYSYSTEYAGSEPSGIVTIDNSQLTIDSWYTIDGKKLRGEPAQKGIYIKNGKKVMK